MNSGVTAASIAAHGQAVFQSEYMIALRDIWAARPRKGNSNPVLQKWLKRHPIDECDANIPYRSLLQLACTLSSTPSGLGLVKLLLEDAGANPNVRTSNGMTALMMCDTADAAQLLLRHGADPALQTHEGATALSYACEVSRLAVCKALLQHSPGPCAEIMKADRKGQTPLASVLCKERESTFLLLMRQLLKQEPSVLRTPFTVMLEPAPQFLLTAVAGENMYKAAELLLDNGAATEYTTHVPPKHRGSSVAVDCCSPLAAAAFEGHLSMVNLLAARGANVNAVCSSTTLETPTALVAAAATGRTAIVKRLLELGADVNAAASDGRGCALQVAAWRGHIDIVKLLIQAGATLRTPLLQQVACLSILNGMSDAEGAKVLQLLVPLFVHGVDYYVRGSNDGFGVTALAHAALHNRKQCAVILHKQGADVNFQDLEGMTAAHFAARAGGMDLLTYLHAAGADLRHFTKRLRLPLHYPCDQGHAAVAEYLLNLEPRHIRAEDHEGRTPLHMASLEGHCDVAELLLQRGASPTVTDHKGIAPLGIAKTAQMTQLLLEAGATVGPFDLHVHAMRGASARSICLLLKAGADPTMRSSDGLLPIDVVRARGETSLVALLTRAAEDFRKAQRQRKATTTSSSSSSSSKSSAAAAAGVSRASAKPQQQQLTGSPVTAGSSSSSSSSTSNSAGNSAAAVAPPAAAAAQQPQAKQGCANCGATKAKLCRRCKAVYYCSVECQRQCFKDPAHKAACLANAVVERSPAA